ncbi:hypothetical protein SAMD00023353_6400460 [Rosellinia necatrix]|uniref:Deoxyribonuclease NucA/NucB domain-containing protein n=1 Tax=Rosellinia necatrix TaxID=77044 RepID=A0A1W2TSS5_ROSNE|nr:hypothetical protein SAMD00023353_6400460 [Rosellinia necatrix]
MPNITNLRAVAAVAGYLALGTAAQNIREYNCNNQPNICSNICFWQICVYPEQTTYTYDSTGDVAGRLADCGVTHSPRPCTFPSLGHTGDEADEFPFASMAEGGRTPFGDGASLLCVSAEEQRVRDGAITQLYRGLAQGTVFELALTNTDGIPYCDPGATPNPGSCDGTEFGGFHHFPNNNIYCQWKVYTLGSIRCVDGQTGEFVDPPAQLLPRNGSDEPRHADWSALLHIREPEVVRRLAVSKPVGPQLDA